MNKNLPFSIILVGFACIQICTAFNIGYLKTDERSCIKCERKNKFYFWGVNSFSIRKPLFLHKNYFYDIQKHLFIDIQHKCWKSKHRANPIVKCKSKLTIKRVKYTQKGSLVQWFTKLKDSLSYVLPSSKSVCLECSRKKQFLPASISSSLIRFNVLMFGSITNNNVHELMCIKPSKIYNKMTTIGGKSSNDSFIVSYLSLPISDNQTVLTSDKQEHKKLNKTEKESYSNWYYWLLRIFKLKCSGEVDDPLKKEPEEVLVIFPRIFRISHQKWFYDLIKILKLRCAPVQTKVMKRNKIDYDWWKHFMLSLKLTSHNQNFRQRKRKKINRKWWERFMLNLKLCSKNTNFKQAIAENKHKYHWYERLVGLFKSPKNVTEDTDDTLIMDIVTTDEIIADESIEIVTNSRYSRLLNSFRLTCHNLYFRPSLYTKTITVKPMKNITIEIPENVTMETPENVTIETSNVTIIIKQNVTSNYPIQSLKIFSFAREKLILHHTRNLGGEIDDAVLFFLFISYLVVWMALHSMSYNGGKKTEQKVTEPIPIKPQPSFKHKKPAKLLPIPAAVIAARKKIELELVVAIVDISPYPSTIVS